MCLFVSALKYCSKGSHEESKQENGVKRPKEQTLQSKDAPLPPARHVPMSQISKDIDHHCPNTKHLPRARAPIHEIPQNPTNDRVPKPATVPTPATPKSRDRKSPTKVKHHADHQNQNQTQTQNERHKSQPKAGAPQQPQRQFSSYRKPHVEEEEEAKENQQPQQPHSKIQQSLLNNQGIPFRSIQPATKDHVLSQGRNSETNPQQPRKHKAKGKESNRTPIQSEPDSENSKKGMMATIKERPEPKKTPCSRQSRRQPQPQPNLHPSPERKPRVVVPNHKNLEDIKTRTAATKPVQHPSRKSNRVPPFQYQYRCSICKITVSHDTMSAFKGACPACLNSACLHAVMEGGRGMSGGGGRKGRGEGGMGGGKGVSGKERKVVGDEGRKERRERR